MQNQYNLDPGSHCGDNISMGRGTHSIIKQKDGSYIVQGYISVREINRQLQIELPLDKSKTLHEMS